ncbi:hypothetical protein EJB05_19964, partial [Eragrostis curvula]
MAMRRLVAPLCRVHDNERNPSFLSFVSSFTCERFRSSTNHRYSVERMQNCCPCALELSGGGEEVGSTYGLDGDEEGRCSCPADTSHAHL